MEVDSYTFLPRSFRPLYESPDRLPGEDEQVWARFEPRLADATIALVSSAGLHVVADQEPFDLEREREDPFWGDPGWRAIPATTPGKGLGMSHLHVRNDDVLADPEIALPARALDALVDDGTVGAAAAEHLSVMGYQQAGLEAWRTDTAPAMVERLRGQGVDGVVLAPV